MTANHMTPRQFLAREIRLARESKGMKVEELASALIVSASLVRAWEAGRRIPVQEDIDKLERFFGFNGVLRRMRDDLVRHEPLPEYMGHWRAIEENSNELLWFHPLIFPGISQTEDYAREVFLTSGRQVDDRDEQVAARIDRQKILTPESGLMFVTVIDEYVLHRPLGGSKVMYDQVAHVVDLARQPNVLVQVVPTDTGGYPGLAGGFGIASVGGQDYAYVDDALSGDVLEDSEEVAVMKRVWNTLRADALPKKQSMGLLEEALKRWAE